MGSKAARRARQSTRTILIVDDCPLLRRGLVALISSELNLEVVGEVSANLAAIGAVAQRTPDLVIIDPALASCEGLALVNQFSTCCPRAATLVLTALDEAAFAERAFRAGAKGFVGKWQIDSIVLTAIRCVLGGNVYMTEELSAQLAHKFVGADPRSGIMPIETLSRRQREVFERIGDGKKMREIAQDLSLSIKTVESHVEHLKRRLFVSSGVELAHCATRWVETGRCD